jgi:hypothetical protein
MRSLRVSSAKRFAQKNQQPVPAVAMVAKEVCSRFVIRLFYSWCWSCFLPIGLGRDPHEIPSPLINKAAPAFQLAQLKDPSKTFSAAEMKGKVWVLTFGHRGVSHVVKSITVT